MRRGGERTALREAHDMGSGVSVPAWTRVTWPRMERMSACVDRELLCRFWGADERGKSVCRLCQTLGTSSEHVALTNRRSCTPC